MHVFHIKYPNILFFRIPISSLALSNYQEISSINQKLPSFTLKKDAEFRFMDLTNKLQEEVDYIRNWATPFETTKKMQS